MSRPIRAILRHSLLVVAVLAVPHAARADHDLLMADLSIRRGRVVAFDETSILFREGAALPAGAAESATPVPRAECLGLIADHVRSSPPSDSGLLVFADGQRLPGRAELDDGQLVWVHEKFGAVSIDLEEVQSIAFEPGRIAPRPGAEDVVVLLNGDRLEGIVASLGTAIVLERGAGATRSEVAIPLERVATLSLVTPPRQAVGPRLWLANGSVIDVSVKPGGDSILQFEIATLRTSSRNRSVPMGEVRGISFGTGAITPLASIEPTLVSGPPERYRVPAPAVDDPAAPLGLAAIALSGPMSVSYTVPAGVRLSAVARLPREALEWGDVELVVRDGAVERWRGVLNALAPMHEILVELEGRSLTLELLEGRHGPVQDVVLLERAILAPLVR